MTDTKPYNTYEQQARRIKADALVEAWEHYAAPGTDVTPEPGELLAFYTERKNDDREWFVVEALAGVIHASQRTRDLVTHTIKQRAKTDNPFAGF